MTEQGADALPGQFQIDIERKTRIGEANAGVDATRRCCIGGTSGA